MASITNLEELPQLVMEKITSFLDHKQLLALEQASTKLKCAVDAHFSITEHIIIGPLPEIERYGKATDKAKKCLDGLLNIIKRCGIRLRTIQINNTKPFPLWKHSMYCKHFFASADMSSNCPNIEYILASPNVDITLLDLYMFRQQNFLLDEDDAEIYANNIKLTTGGTCRLRSISLLSRWVTEESYQRIVNLFPSLEQIYVCVFDENIYKILPQLIQNGLKDLSIVLAVNLRIAKTLCNICKNLRTLRFDLTVENNDDIAALNKLQIPQNAELKVTISRIDNLLSRLNENVFNYISKCDVSGTTDYRLISKLKNLQEINIRSPKQLQVIAEGSFPKLRKILNGTTVCSYNNCIIAKTCNLQTFLPQLLINKGNQLTHIEIQHVCNKSMPVVWKALKNCKAAKSIRFYLVQVVSSSSVTFDDMAAICDLPDLHQFIFSIHERIRDNNVLSRRLCALLARAAKNHTDFQFENKFSWLSLYGVVVFGRVYELLRLKFLT